MPHAPGRPPLAHHRDEIRPPMLPFEIGLAIEGYTLVNYRVPLERLAPHLPADLVPVTTQIDGVPSAWFSIFLGTNVIRALGAVPVWPLVIHQINYRTYIQLEGGHGVYILRSVVGLPVMPSMLAAPMSLGAHWLLDFPVQVEPVRLTREYQGDRLTSLQAVVGSPVPELSLEVRSLGGAPETPGFATPEEAVTFLGDLPEAYLPLAPHHYRQLLAFHPPLHPEGGRVIAGSCRWLEAAGILEQAELLEPESVFLQGCAPFPTYV